MIWLTRNINGNRPPVDAYTRLDLRMAHRVRWGDASGELALVIQNAGDSYQEYRRVKIFDTHTYLTLNLNF
jgi:hypothetical protein